MLPVPNIISLSLRQLVDSVRGKRGELHKVALSILLAIAAMEVRSVLEWSLVITCILGLWSVLCVPISFFITSTANTQQSRLNSSGCDTSQDQCLEDFNKESNITEEAKIVCQRNFYFDEDFQGCVPSCQTWSDLGESATVALRVVVLMFDSMGILLATVAIVVSIVKYKLMFQFPTIFLVFSTTDIFLIHLIAMIGYSNSNLFCSSPTILNNTATPFCIVSGMFFVYSYIQQELWWIFHLLVIFWGIWFPFHYKKYKSNGRLKKVMIVCTVAGLMLPFLPIIGTVSSTAVEVSSEPNVTITSHGLGYNVFNNLPIFCASGRVGFFTYTLPLTLTLAGGGPLIILIIFYFCKTKSAAASDLKLIVVLGYYLLLTCVSIAVFIVFVKNSESLIQSYRNYFDCERQGLQTNYSCPRDYEQYNVSYAVAVLLVVLALYPLYVLLFAVNIMKIKEVSRNHFCNHILKAT